MFQTTNQLLMIDRLITPLYLDRLYQCLEVSQFSIQVLVNQCDHQCHWPHDNLITQMYDDLNPRWLIKKYGVLGYIPIYIYIIDNIYIQYIGSKPLTSTEMLISMYPVAQVNSPSDRCHRRQCSRLPRLPTELGSPSSCASVQTSLVPISEGYGSKMVKTPVPKRYPKS